VRAGTRRPRCRNAIAPPDKHPRPDTARIFEQHLLLIWLGDTFRAPYCLPPGTAVFTTHDFGAESLFFAFILQGGSFGGDGTLALMLNARLTSTNYLHRSSDCDLQLQVRLLEFLSQCPCCPHFSACIPSTHLGFNVGNYRVLHIFFPLKIGYPPIHDPDLLAQVERPETTVSATDQRSLHTVVAKPGTSPPRDTLDCPSIFALIICRSYHLQRHNNL
jgi:hypothetical protein